MEENNMQYILQKKIHEGTDQFIKFDWKEVIVCGKENATKFDARTAMYIRQEDERIITL